MKRSNQKRITKEAIILRYMRMEKGLSLNQAGRRVGITGSAIAHIEQGRMDVSRARIETLVEGYGYTLDDSRLQAVHAVLVNFMPSGTARCAESPPQCEQPNRRRYS